MKRGFTTNEKLVRDVAEDIETEYQRRLKRKTMEESHIRTTFLLDRELNKRLNNLSSKKERGFKTLFLNRVIQAALNEAEQNEHLKK